ncbi:hypothetical protein K456DRAFT_1946389 [Colletotrichum gloeosporioides 23]|nr:hypothetical protein K456DRAFT_1946389 [Colletotrichum gloeosporioides 23]
MSWQPEWTVVLLGTSLSIVWVGERGTGLSGTRQCYGAIAQLEFPRSPAPFTINGSQATVQRGDRQKVRCSAQCKARIWQWAWVGGEQASAATRRSQSVQEQQPQNGGSWTPPVGWPNWHCTTSFSACVRWALADMELEVPNSEVLLGLPNGNGCPEDREQRAVSAVSFHSTSTRSLNVKTSIGAHDSDSLSAVSTDKAREPK